jgi:hypothetical protein
MASAGKPTSPPGSKPTRPIGDEMMDDDKIMRVMRTGTGRKR